MMHDELLAGLNPAQREAVTTVKGPVLVLAGPGSGKTRVLAHRVAYLLRHANAHPRSIMAVTFTNKAAGEMRERINKLVGQAVPVSTGWRGLTIGTFHSICARILRADAPAAGLNPNFVIYDDGEQLTAVKQALRDLKLDEKLYKPEAMRSAISKAKNELIRPQQFEATTYWAEIARRVYARYEEILTANGGLDFDDLLCRVAWLFREQPEVLKRYQDRYEYLLVDEFQDTNTAQYDLVCRLAAASRNLFAVGDEDQCLVAGTEILTPTGPVTVEQVRVGDRVLAAAGHGSRAVGTVDACPSHHYAGDVVTVCTAYGRQLTATPEHCVFARFDPNNDRYRYVYLMYSRRLGYRIGQTGAIRSNGDKKYPGFTERLRQERGDAIWLLRACGDAGEATYWESYYAAKYGLPTACFYADGRRVSMTNEHIQRLYSELDTAGCAARLVNDLGLSLAHPHHVPQTTIRGASLRKTISLNMFGASNVKYGGGRWHRPFDPWHLHELSICSSDEPYRQQVEQVLPTRPHKEIYWQARRTHGDYDAMLLTLDELTAAIPDARIWKRAKLTDETFEFMPIGNLVPGAILPVLDVNGKVTEDEVVAVNHRHYDGLVYDLSVPNYRNYVAGGIVVHNSIYMFRGADYRNVMRFREDFPEAKVVLLEQNYRSTQTILDVANAVIARNQHRTPKKLRTDRGQGLEIISHEAYDEADEAAFVVSTIQRLVRGHQATLGDCAVMYRTNAQSRSLEDAFIARGIPYRLVGGVRFYQRREIKDALAYLRLVHNPADNISLGRIINVPPRSIGDKTVSNLAAWSAELGVPMVGGLALLAGDLHSPVLDDEFRARHTQAPQHPFGAAAVKSLTAFYKMLARWLAVKDGLTVAELLDRITEESSYTTWLRDGTEEGEDRWANVQELRSVAAHYDDFPPDLRLTAFLEEVALVSDQDDLAEPEDRVTLLTIHTAKGLEFPVVFIVGLEENIFPHSRSMEDPDQMEEERRLMYVAVTRAKDRLYLLRAFRRMLYGRSEVNEPSRFLKDVVKVQGVRNDAANGRAASDRAGGYGNGGLSERAGYGGGFSARSTARSGDGPPWGQSSRPATRGLGRASEPPTRSAGNMPSRLPAKPPARAERPLQFKPGDRVDHGLFGQGIVIKSEPTADDEEVTVAFAGKGTKTLLAGFAKLRKL